MITKFDTSALTTSKSNGGGIITLFKIAAIVGIAYAGYKFLYIPYKNAQEAQK
jgi:uncharacterized membrane-anchored protein